MEALHAVAVAALTVYDMVKAADKAMTIGEIRLVRKSGGRGGDVPGALKPPRAAAPGSCAARPRACGPSRLPSSALPASPRRL